MNCINDWLRKLALRPKKVEVTNTRGALEDPFDVSFFIRQLLPHVLYALFYSNH